MEKQAAISEGKGSYLTDVAIDEHVTTIQIPVNNTRLMGVQIIQALENLLGPLLQSLHGNMLVLLPVIPQITRGANFSNEIQSVFPLVPPHMVQSNDVLVL